MSTQKHINIVVLIQMIEQSLFLDVEKQIRLIAVIEKHPEADYAKLEELLEQGAKIQAKIYQEILKKNPNFLKDLDHAINQKFSELATELQTGESLQADDDLKQKLNTLS